MAIPSNNLVCLVKGRAEFYFSMAGDEMRATCSRCGFYEVKKYTPPEDLPGDIGPIRKTDSPIRE